MHGGKVKEGKGEGGEKGSLCPNAKRGRKNNSKAQTKRVETESGSETKS